jgi:hypothetical protein
VVVIDIIGGGEVVVIDIIGGGEVHFHISHFTFTFTYQGG